MVRTPEKTITHNQQLKIINHHVRNIPTHDVREHKLLRRIDRKVNQREPIVVKERVKFSSCNRARPGRASRGTTPSNRPRARATVRHPGCVARGRDATNFSIAAAALAENTVPSGARVRADPTDSMSDIRRSALGGRTLLSVFSALRWVGSVRRWVLGRPRAEAAGTLLGTTRWTSPYHAPARRTQRCSASSSRVMPSCSRSRCHPVFTKNSSRWPMHLSHRCWPPRKTRQKASSVSLRSVAIVLSKPG